MENIQEKKVVNINAQTIPIPIEQVPEHTSPEMAQLILKMHNHLKSGNKRELIKMRRDIRRRLFRIRDALIENRKPDPKHDSGLRAWMELQFNDGRLKWFQKSVDKQRNSHTFNKEIISGGFTFEWDVSAEEPLKLIEPIEWDGGIDELLYQRCKVKRCVPPAFTKQK